MFFRSMVLNFPLKVCTVRSAVLRGILKSRRENSAAGALGNKNTKFKLVFVIILERAGNVKICPNCLKSIQKK